MTMTNLDQAELDRQTVIFLKHALMNRWKVSNIMMALHMPRGIPHQEVAEYILTMSAQSFISAFGQACFEITTEGMNTWNKLDLGRFFRKDKDNG
jgi:hypothetical protein